MKALIILLLSFTMCEGQSKLKPSHKLFDLDSAFRNLNWHYRIPSLWYDEIDRTLERAFESKFCCYPPPISYEILIIGEGFERLAYKENGGRWIVNDASAALEVMLKSSQRDKARYEELKTRYDAAIELIIRLSPKSFRLPDEKTHQL